VLYLDAMSLRSVAALVLGVLGVLAITVAVPAVWTRDHMLDTENYVSTVRPIAGDVRLQADVIVAVDQQITSRLNVASLVKGALPAALRRLGSTFQLAVDGFVDKVVTRFVRSTTFADLWCS
jgi:hypothetical protein